MKTILFPVDAKTAYNLLIEKDKVLLTLTPLDYEPPFIGLIYIHSQLPIIYMKDDMVMRNNTNKCIPFDPMEILNENVVASFTCNRVDHLAEDSYETEYKMIKTRTTLSFDDYYYFATWGNRGVFAIDVSGINIFPKFKRISDYWTFDKTVLWPVDGRHKLNSRTRAPKLIDEALTK